MKDYDWNRIRTVYITGTDSYRALCGKFGVPKSTLMKRGRAENWVGQREEYQRNLVAKVGERTAESEASKLIALREASDNLTEELISRTADMSDCTAKDILDYTRALKDLTATARNLYDLPSQAERESQRISAERLEIERKRLSAVDTDASVKVIFSGGEDLREGKEDNYDRTDN